ncbi:MAG TPA: hypothetical protein VFE08_13270, partial [Candidatus Sulfotelmatobacter sp.]|nr:hypothetical protein [Candidatus Sulfotelmatobacter sp.]
MGKIKVRILLLIVAVASVGLSQTPLTPRQQIAALQDAEDFLLSRLSILETQPHNESLPATAIPAQRQVLENRLLAI